MIGFLKRLLVRPKVEPERYLAGLVGESYRQAAIRKCSVGDQVSLQPDPGNAHDPRAIGAFARGGQIGFLPRDGWLTQVIIDERKPVTAKIKSLTASGGGHTGVVIAVNW